MIYEPLYTDALTNHLVKQLENSEYLCAIWKERWEATQKLCEERIAARDAEYKAMVIKYERLLD